MAFDPTGKIPWTKLSSGNGSGSGAQSVDHTDDELGERMDSDPASSSSDYGSAFGDHPDEHPTGPLPEGTDCYLTSSLPGHGSDLSALPSSSSSQGLGSGDQPDGRNKNALPERTDSLADPNGPLNTATDTPNTRDISTQAPDTPSHVNDGEEPNNHEGMLQVSAHEDRYEDLDYLVDRTGASYNCSGSKLTEKPPGSVSHARAEAQRRLQRSENQRSDPNGPLKIGTDLSNMSPDERMKWAIEVSDPNRKPKPKPGPVRPDPNSHYVSPETFRTVMYDLTKDPNLRPKGRSSGKWRCCKCNRGHKIYTQPHILHPLYALSCECTHRPCAKCKLESAVIKQFQPMNNPEVVHLSEDLARAIRFGVICEGCGLSWRAKRVPVVVKKTPKKSVLQRVSSLTRSLNKRGGGGAPTLKDLRSSRSMSNLHDPTQSRSQAPPAASRSSLDLHALRKEMKKEHGVQAEPVPVKFVGIKCTCTMTTADTSLCFQGKIIDKPKDHNQTQLAEHVAARKPAGFGSTPEDIARGHGTPTLTLRGKQHDNPLMSNLVA